MNTERENKLALFHTQARDIVRHLIELDTQAWKAIANECYVTLERRDGMKVGLYLDTWRGRAEASPRCPKRRGGCAGLREWGMIGYGEKGPSAGYSVDRPANRVAGDIWRKVIEPYAEMFPKIQQHQKTDIEQAEGREIALQALEKANGTKRYGNGGEHGSQTVPVSIDGEANIYGQFTLQSYGTVDLNIRSLSYDQAQRLSEFIKTELASMPAGASASDNPLAAIEPDDRATILAALRYWQEEGLADDPGLRSDALHEIATDSGEQISLDSAGIDQLCERLNITG